MKYFMVAFWKDLKQREITIGAMNRYHARRLAIDVYGILEGSIIQIKEVR